MNKEKCKNCGGDYSIHKWDDLACPFGGREAPFPRKQEWMKTHYVEDDSETQDKLTELRTALAEMREALEDCKKTLVAWKKIKCGQMNWDKGDQKAVENAEAILAKYPRKETK